MIRRHYHKIIALLIGWGLLPLVSMILR